MKRLCLAVILVFILCVQVFPASANGVFDVFKDEHVASGSAYLNSKGKAIFKLTTTEEAAKIKVISCDLYKKSGNSSSKVQELDPPTTVAQNRSVYNATKDYSSYCTSGQTYYIVATFDIDGYTKSYTSPAVTIK